MININDEVSVLKSVILGVSCKKDEEISEKDFYDPKSLEHFLKGTYPRAKDLQKEISSFEAVLKKYNIKVFRPKKQEGVNQIFVRDTGFVIDNVFIKANILPKRNKELLSILPIIEKNQPKKLVEAPKDVHIEGGDIILYKDYIFVGIYSKSDYADLITARTNKAAVSFLEKQFPNKIIKAFNLKKSNTDAKKNTLHLDCCFQPVGNNKAIIYKGGFEDENDYFFIINLFKKENVFELDQEEAFDLQTNIFSISKKVVVSDKSFTRLNKWLSLNGVFVEEISYKEISKQSGLFRCSTLPLKRINN